jgi:glutaconate CoA-transferase subunit A
MRGYIGGDLPKVNDQIKFIECPFTGERLAAVPAIRPDVGVIHAQRADRKGNVLVEGIIGVQKEVVLAAKRSIVTVEEIVDELGAGVNACVIPSWAITAIVEAPRGASPSYALGYYDRDNAFYKEWDTIARDRDTFAAWLNDNFLKKELRGES